MKSLLAPDRAVAGLAASQTFANRRSAGMLLAGTLNRLQLPADPEVLALPRGGVPVAFEVARALHVPVHVLVVRKIGMPGDPELAIGAIASGGVVVHEPGLEGHLHLAGIGFDELVHEEMQELRRRERLYQREKQPPQLAGRAVLLVDDGLATGATMLAAVRAARKAGAAHIVVLAPVASAPAASLVAGEADDVMFLKMPAYLNSIGEWYDEFPQLTDAEVCELLDDSANFGASRPRKSKSSETR